MDTNCAPLLTDLFLYSFAADFLEVDPGKKEKTLAQSFTFSFCYIYG